jgi:cysteine desulfurase family protein
VTALPFAAPAPATAGSAHPDGLVYLDNAATTWPKPGAVGAAMLHYLEAVGASPGRGGHRLAVEAGREVLDARERLAELVGLPDPERVVLLKNATEALNVALLGLLRPGDRVVVGSLEHNAVMRPLRYLETTREVSVHVVGCDPRGALEPARLARALEEPARLVVTAHASNVTGAVAPLAELADVTHAAGAELVVDAAQTAGAYPIDMLAQGIDLLAFTGHKSLFGPQGTGGLCVLGTTPEPIMFGGTGSNSEEERLPGFLPDRLESGTLNGVGFAGLAAGIAYVAGRSVAEIQRQGRARLARLLDGLLSVPGVRVHGPRDPERQIGVVSLSLERRSPGEVGLLLDERYGILCRVGLHCSPAAHRTLGTFPVGTVRFSLSDMTTDEEIDRAVAAIRELAAP